MIILANAIGTFAFAITAVTAAIVFTTAAQWVGAITAMSLFAVGVFAFLWSFWNVVQRSREELVGVTQVYLLVGPPTPGRVRVRMLGLLAVQIVVALVTALSRTETADGRAGSSLALGCARADVRPRAQRALGGVPRHVPPDPRTSSPSRPRTRTRRRTRPRPELVNSLRTRVRKMFTRSRASRRRTVRSARM